MRLIIGCLLLCLVGCKVKQNSPYPESWLTSHTLFSVFSSAPKTLDPAKAYTSESARFIQQVYETPLQYAVLQRPYQLIPGALSQLPVVTELNAKKQPKKKNEITAYTRYTLTIRQDLRYAPSPLFVHKTRSVTADDFIYQIKRLASPQVNSPIYGLMKTKIVGLSKLNQALVDAQKKQPNQWINLNHFPCEGVVKLNRWQYQITLKGRYPPFRYWLAMPFFTAMPWEADQANKQRTDFSLDWQMVGSGPYQLSENNPNQRMVLVKNPYFHPEFYPAQSQFPELTGKRLPLIPRVIFSLEKESSPLWHKFLQGYYDRSGIGNDQFSSVVTFNREGHPELTTAFKEKGLSLNVQTVPSIFYLGFNQLDPLVGGTSERARKLRQAIAIAIDYEEFIRLFLNGRGIAAHSPIPIGIDGAQVAHHSGLNHTVYQSNWQRKSITEAKKRLAEAGYPEGVDPATKKPLILHYDVPASPGPETGAQMAWMRKQFAKLGLVLDIRPTQYNRFQTKVANGQVQLFLFGWAADYPDPENFLFLFYGPNGRVKYHGENTSNYANPEYDRLFEAFKQLPPGSKKHQLLQQMVALLQQDVPWVFGFYPKSFLLSHHWIKALPPHPMTQNTLKYLAIDVNARTLSQNQWNQPDYRITLSLLGLLILLGMAGVGYQVRRNQRNRLKRQNSS